jgi:hypothetical protein
VGGISLYLAFSRGSEPRALGIEGLQLVLRGRF